MLEKQAIQCPECDDPAALDGAALDRRGFMRTIGGTASALAVGAVAGSAPQLGAFPPAQEEPRQAKPAEALVRELFEGLTDDQKRRVVYPWNHGAGENRIATRLGMYNSAIFRDHNIANVYTRAQKELCERILRSISNGDDGYRQVSRNGTFDESRSFNNCGAYIFGDPTNNGQFAWVFTGHHLTVRCDGNSEPDAAFGGPMYYGHSPDGYSQRNCFNYQTRSVLRVYDSLTEAQRRMAKISYPDELARSVRFRNDSWPGLPASEMTRDQRRLVEQVMRDVLSPFRQEDGDEVMQIIRRNGGLEQIRIGFYRDAGSTDRDRWNFWRLEGPGFVWNYRVLPHVHTYVNIAARPRG